MVIFSGLLFFGTIGLWIATNSNAVAAKRAAEAAERALTDFERPWLFHNGTKIARRDQNEVRAGKGPVRNAYFVTISLENAGRMLAVIESIEVKFIDKNVAPENPDYSEMFPLNFPIFVNPGKKTTLNKPMDGIGSIGPPNGPDTPIEYVFYGLVRYKGLNSRAHTTGFGIAISAVMPVCASFGGDKYNYHH